MMKIRTYFISNSSSSSFVAVVDPDAYNDLKEELNRVELELLEDMEKREKRKLNDNYYVLLADYMYTEEPEQAELLEEIFEEEGIEALREALDMEDDGEIDLSSEYIRAEIAVDIVGELRDKINRLAASGKAITYYQNL